jgi:TolB-like protein/lipopolysaccharide biosynthesis regulator YciM
MRLNPHHPQWYKAYLAAAYFEDRQYNNAIKTSESLIGIGMPNTQNRLAASYAYLGNIEKANVHAAKVLEQEPNFSIQSFAKSRSYREKSNLEHYLEGLRLAGLPETSPPALLDKPSIAVLPFTNMSSDAEQEYFVDGMTEDVITDLSKLSGLFVIARNSVLTYKDRSPEVQQVAEELGVKYVLQGSVRRAGDQLRINAQLVNAETGKHLWAERYDRKLQSIFAIQDEIAASIVRALKIQLGTEEKEALKARATINFEAYDLFLKGQRSLSSRTQENISEAISMYRKAIELDPEFSRAYGATAVAMTFQYRRGFTDTPLETMNLALELVQKAAAMNSNIPQVYWSLGYVHLFRKEYDKAIQAVQYAIQISPNYADAYGLLSLIYNHQGNSNEAIENITKGMKLNPYYSYDYPYNLGRAQYLAGRYEEAIDNLNKALEKNETAPTPRIYLIASYVKAGMIDDAEWEVENLQLQNPEMTISQLRRTSAQKDTLMDELALDLRKAGVPD